MNTLKKIKELTEQIIVLISLIYLGWIGTIVLMSNYPIGLKEVILTILSATFFLEDKIEQLKNKK